MFFSRCSHLRCRSCHFDCLLLVFIRRWRRLLVLCHLYHSILMWLVDFHPHCSDEYWFHKLLLLEQRVCEAVHIQSSFALCKGVSDRASLLLPTTTSHLGSLQVWHDQSHLQCISWQIFPSFLFCISVIMSYRLFRSVFNKLYGRTYMKWWG